MYQWHAHRVCHNKEIQRQQIQPVIHHKLILVERLDHKIKRLIIKNKLVILQDKLNKMLIHPDNKAPRQPRQHIVDLVHMTTYTYL
jgi:hypothetical protein